MEYLLTVENQKIQIQGTGYQGTSGLLNKLRILSRIGVPSVILGKEASGKVLVKQAFLQKLNDPTEDTALNWGSLEVYPLDGRFFANSYVTASPVMARMDGKWFLIGDIRVDNVGFDSSGELRPFDLTAAELTNDLVFQVKGLQEWLDTIPEEETPPLDLGNPSDSSMVKE